MKSFTLSLKSASVFVSQLQQADLSLPYSFEVNSDQYLQFDFQLELQYEHLQQHPELLKLFREKSDLYRLLPRPIRESILIPLTQLVGTWEFDNGNHFKGSVPYNLHNLEVFLDYFRR